MTDKKNNLATYYPKPKEGEEIPIQFIDMEEKLVGWSPKLKKTIYLDISCDYNPETLKRIRHVFLLKVYNWLLDGISIIELNDQEKIQFEDILNDFILYGGEIRFTRIKHGKKIIKKFTLAEISINVHAHKTVLTELL